MDTYEERGSLGLSLEPSKQQSEQLLQWSVGMEENGGVLLLIRVKRRTVLLVYFASSCWCQDLSKY